MKQSIIFSILLGLALLLITLQKTFQIKPKDHKQVANFEAKIQKQKQAVCCKKSGLQKDIFFLEDGKRLHCKIKSDYSQFFTQGHKVFEKLQNVQCFLQDQLIQNEQETTQQIKYFTANEGIYFLPSHRFFSKKVNLAFFSLHGSDIPKDLDLEEAYLKGHAQKVSLQLNQNKKIFEATHLHALFKADTVKEKYAKSKKPL